MRAALALFIAGLGWGTTGLFVRALGRYGLSVFDLLVIRLAVTAVIIIPVFLFIKFRSRRVVDVRTTIVVGLAMVFYYVGAITAFHNLPLVTAALLIGSSPLIAWLLPLVIERRKPRAEEWRPAAGVLIAIAGLLLLTLTKTTIQTAPHDMSAPLGYLGGFIAAFVTVFNARILRRLGPKAPGPVEITAATVSFGLIISPAFFLPYPIPGIENLLLESLNHPWLCFGFGVLSTAVPGLAISYAAARLPAQATSTVSIQLQIWSGVLAWAILGEAMTLVQILAALLVVIGSAICLRPTASVA